MTLVSKGGAIGRYTEVSAMNILRSALALPALILLSASLAMANKIEVTFTGNIVTCR